MRRVITGTVTSDKPDQTIVITVVARKTHPLYKKQYTRATKYMAHDPQNKARIGDRVRIAEIRPMSARKKFELRDIIARASVGFEEADATADIPVEETTTKENKA